MLELLKRRRTGKSDFLSLITLVLILLQIDLTKINLR